MMNTYIHIGCVEHGFQPVLSKFYSLVLTSTSWFSAEAYSEAFPFPSSQPLSTKDADSPVCPAAKPTAVGMRSPADPDDDHLHSDDLNPHFRSESPTAWSWLRRWPRNSFGCSTKYRSFADWDDWDGDADDGSFAAKRPLVMIACWCRLCVCSHWDWETFGWFLFASTFPHFSTKF